MARDEYSFLYIITPSFEKLEALYITMYMSVNVCVCMCIIISIAVYVHASSCRTPMTRERKATFRAKETVNFKFDS